LSQQEVNNLIKNLLEKLMLEERRICLEEIEDYTKGASLFSFEDKS
jgi:hypothetical protein